VHIKELIEVPWLRVKKNKVINYIKKKTPKEKNALIRELFDTIGR